MCGGDAGKKLVARARSATLDVGDTSAQNKKSKNNAATTGGPQSCLFF